MPKIFLFFLFNENVIDETERVYINLLQLVADGVDLQKVLQENFMCVVVQAFEAILSRRFSVTARESRTAGVPLEAIAEVPSQSVLEILIGIYLRAAAEEVRVSVNPARLGHSHL